MCVRERVREILASPSIHPYLYIESIINRHIDTYMYTYTHTHTQPYTYVHTYIHINTHAHSYSMIMLRMNP